MKLPPLLKDVCTDKALHTGRKARPRQAHEAERTLLLSYQYFRI